MNILTIGRNTNNTIVVPSSYSTVSGSHATIYIDNGEYVYEDHSSNGSYINGVKLHHEKITISPNDVILLSSQYRLDNNMVFQEVKGTRMEYLSPRGRSTERFSRGDYPPLVQPPVYGPTSPDNRGTDKPDHPSDNVSGFASNEPSNLHSFNFGAFIFGWIWGICNGVYIALLTLIPAINLIMSIVLGVKGNEWAWEKQKSTVTPQSFVQNQKRWSKAALIIIAISFASILFYVSLFVLTFS